MNILITGISGSSGSYLAEYIHTNYPQIQIHGLTRNIFNIRNSKFYYHECDLLNLKYVVEIMNKIKPDHIFHFASMVSVKDSINDPLKTINNNVIGTANLLEAIRLTNIDTNIQICSSADVYKSSQSPIDEIWDTCPITPYAMSKLMQEQLAILYYKTYGIKCVILRMFSCLSPRRPDLFVSSFAQKIVEIEQGKREILSHGNLNSIRTLLDIRDAIEACWIASEECIPGEIYNIGGTQTVSIVDILEALKMKAKVPIHSELDINFSTGCNLSVKIPDIFKFVNLTGWKARYSLDQSLNFLLNYYRNK